jgi:signal transduction histidine kinase
MAPRPGEKDPDLEVSADEPVTGETAAGETAAGETAAGDGEEGLDAEARFGPAQVGAGLAFRTRLTIALIAAATLPLAAFGLLLIVAQRLPDAEATIPRLLLLAIVLATLLAVLVAYMLSAELTSPLRAIASAVDRVKAGDLSTPIVVAGDDELAQLADSHNRLAADLERRNRELGRILAGIVHGSPGEGAGWLLGRAATDAREAFDLIDAQVRLVDPDTVPMEEIVPADPRPVRAVLRAGDERIGLLTGHLPATRTWERADQDLLELFAAEVGVSLRNAELFARVEAQNAQLLELDAAKDDFLRGVSHNLQTPLTSIRAYADQLAGKRPDRRLGIIAEQSERLSRMVRQLLTVTRLESGALRPTAEVVALAPRVRRAWEAIAVEEIPFQLTDHSKGWLAVADVDQLDQVLWALLDNAVKHGGRGGVDVEIAAEEGRLRLTLEDHGPGVHEVDRGRLFDRFARGSNQNAEDGSGLGLYVSRELCRAMGGDLVLELAVPGHGAAFSIWLPAESGDEA